MRQFLFFSVCLLIKTQITCAQQQTPFQDTIAIIGSEAVTYGAIYCEIKKEECYGNTITPIDAIVRQIDASVAAAILKATFSDVSRQEMQDYLKYIDSTSKAPLILECIQSVCHEVSPDAYSLWVVYPLIVNNLLHENFYYSRKIHKNTYEVALRYKNQICSKAYSPDSLSHYREWDIPKTEANKKLPFVVEVIGKMDKTMKCPIIWEGPYNFVLPLNLNEFPDRWEISALVIPKQKFEEWYFEAIRQNIIIKWKDWRLASLVRQYYPQWWDLYTHHTSI